MPPRKPDPWQARTALWMPLVILLGGVWITDRVQAARTDAATQHASRENDDIMRRLAAVEARCKP